MSSYTVKAPVTEPCCIISCWIPSAVLRLYDALAYCSSLLYALGYEESLQVESEGVEYSELEHAGLLGRGRQQVVPVPMSM